MNAQIRKWFGTVGWFGQLLCGCFCQESDYPTFYHLAVLDYKPRYNQKPWLIRPNLIKVFIFNCWYQVNIRQEKSLSALLATR